MDYKRIPTDSPRERLIKVLIDAKAKFLESLEIPKDHEAYKIEPKVWRPKK